MQHLPYSTPISDLMFMPVSGLTGANLKEGLDPKVCPWYDGKPFLTYLDELPPFDRTSDGPFRWAFIKLEPAPGTGV